MEILDHNDQHQPTLMKDLIATLVGENVIVYLNGCGYPLSGKLQSCNGYILHLTTMYTSNVYIPVDKINAIGSEK